MTTRLAHHAVADDRLNHRVAALRLCASLQCRGLDVQRLLVDAGLSAQLASEPAARVGTAQMVALLKVARVALNDDLYGFGTQALKPGTIHYMFELGLRCETLEALIAHCARFVGQLVADLSVDLVREPGVAGLRIRLTQPALDPDHFLRDQLLLYWYRVLSWAVGYPVPLVRLDVCVDEAPSPDRLSYWICRSWAPRQPCAGFYFDSRYLSLPVVRTPAEWHLQAMDQANGLPEWPEGAQAWHLRLKALWRAEFKRGLPLPSLEAAAVQLGVGPRTLRRHLAREGTSYQQVLDQLLLETAIDKLHAQRLRLSDVATQLGFAEPRSFSRAFKRWTGVSPSRYGR